MVPKEKITQKMITKNGLKQISQRLIRHFQKNEGIDLIIYPISMYATSFSYITDSLSWFYYIFLVKHWMTSLDSRVAPPTAENLEKVTIYVRNYDKKAIILRLPPLVRLDVLKEKVYRKMKIPLQDQAIFLQGNLLGNIQEIPVENKQIFHVVNLKRTNLDSMTIFIKRIEANSPRHSFTINPQTTIGEFFET